MDLHTVDNGVLRHLPEELSRSHLDWTVSVAVGCSADVAPVTAPGGPLPWRRSRRYQTGYYLYSLSELISRREGHKHSSQHPEMERKLRQLDEAIGATMRRLDNDTLLVVLSDHG
jgi:hypothetical protein